MNVDGMVLKGAFAASALAGIASTAVAVQENRSEHPDGGFGATSMAIPGALFVAGGVMSLLGGKFDLVGDAGVLMMGGALLGSMTGSLIGGLAPRSDGMLAALHGADHVS
jgi:hypothetical protein